MNRQYRQFRLGLENRVVDLYCNFAVGASGAPTISASKSKGVASISRSSAGKYVITLQDYYVDLFHVTPMVVLAAGSPNAPIMVVRAQTVATAKTVTVEFLDETLTADDISSGATVVLKLELKASTV
jgi:hypothetical protein